MSPQEPYLLNAISGAWINSDSFGRDSLEKFNLINKYKSGNNILNVYNSIQSVSPDRIPLQLQKDFYKFHIHLETMKYLGYQQPAKYLFVSSTTDASVKHFFLKYLQILHFCRLACRAIHANQSRKVLIKWFDCKNRSQTVFTCYCYFFFFPHMSSSRPGNKSTFCLQCSQVEMEVSDRVCEEEAQRWLQAQVRSSCSSCVVRGLQEAVAIPHTRAPSFFQPYPCWNRSLG